MYQEMQREFLERSIEIKSGGSPSKGLEWKRALAAHPLFESEEARPIVEAASSPTQIQAVAVLSGSYDGKEALHCLMEAVDASDADLPDWLQALEIIQSHLRRQSRKVTLVKAIGYIECCIAAAASADVNLSECVHDMLAAHGIEG